MPSGQGLAHVGRHVRRAVKGSLEPGGSISHKATGLGMHYGCSSLRGLVSSCEPLALMRDCGFGPEVALYVKRDT